MVSIWVPMNSIENSCSSRLERPGRIARGRGRVVAQADEGLPMPTARAPG